MTLSWICESYSNNGICSPINLKRGSLSHGGSIWQCIFAMEYLVNMPNCWIHVFLPKMPTIVNIEGCRHTFLPTIYYTRDLPGIALVITFFMTLFTKKKLNFWTNAPFRKFYNMIVKTSQQWFKINGKNAFGCPYVWDYISK